MLRPRLRIPRLCVPRPISACHRKHSVPESKFQGGVPGFLEQGYELAWDQQMWTLTAKLNALTDGTALENKDTKQLLVETAREPSKAPIFNYASMLHNTDFFFRGLRKGGIAADPAAAESGEPGQVQKNENAMPLELRKQLEDNFSSLESLRRELILTASGMFGPGFVWLVKAAKSDVYRLLVTYLAGTPYSEAHWRRQGVDMNTVGGAMAPRTTNIAGGATVLGTDSVAHTTTQEYFARQNAGAEGRTTPGGIQVVPLLCVSTWEHVWMLDYHIGYALKDKMYDGKKQYLNKWWDCIDWDFVWDNVMRANESRKSVKQESYSSRL